MKVKTIGSIKFMRLKRVLSLAHYEAVGLLESLWIVTAQNTPAGGIGKFSDEDLAAMIEWRGDAGALVAALVDAGWLDPCPVDRLVVHDWLDHCPTWVRGVLANPARKHPLLSPPLSAPLSPPLSGALKIPDLDPSLSGALPSLLFSSPLLTSLYQGTSGAAFPCRSNEGESGKEWHPTKKKIAEWVALFPALDVPAELDAARLWLQVNTHRLKTHRGMGAYLGNWLRRCKPSARSALAMLSHAGQNEGADNQPNANAGQIVGQAEGETNRIEDWDGKQKTTPAMGRNGILAELGKLGGDL